MFDNVIVTGPGLFKATAYEDGGDRIVVIEPSEEVVDLEGEKILQEALWDSREYFLKKGNLDVDHMSWIGYDKGFKDQDYFDIGKPLEVKGGPERVQVIARVATGSEMADKIWKRMTKRNPPIRYYPSIGAHREKSEMKHEPAGAEYKETSRMRWVNIAFCKEPVNQDVSPIQVRKPETIAKAILGGGVDMQSFSHIAVHAAYTLAVKGERATIDYIDSLDLTMRRREELIYHLTRAANI